MPIVPDAPFPKTAGLPIRSKDWNDLVKEVQRLDTAKLNLAGGAMTGPLTIQAALNQAALGVGTATPAAGARLHVVDSASPTVLRIQSTAAFGAARVELWSDPQGPNEWRPGYVESLDLGNWTGGLRFVTNGQTAAQRTGSVEAMRVVKGRVGISVLDPAFPLDVGDRIRLRHGNSGSAGLWLFQATPNEDRAFIGMNGDDVVGLWGNKGAGWALQMNVSNGNLALGGVAPQPAYRLYVNGNAYVNGRMRDEKIRSEALASNQIPIVSQLANVTLWQNVPDMSLSVLSTGGWFTLRFQMGGVQVDGVPTAHAEFQLMVNGGRHAYTLHEFHNAGWELREVSLQRLIWLPAGTHNVQVQWSVKSPNTHAAIPWPPQPEVRATMRGCWYGDTRTLTAIEL